MRSTPCDAVLAKRGRDVGPGAATEGAVCHHSCRWVVSLVPLFPVLPLHSSNLRAALNTRREAGEMKARQGTSILSSGPQSADGGGGSAHGQRRNCATWMQQCYRVADHLCSFGCLIWQALFFNIEQLLMRSACADVWSIRVNICWRQNQIFFFQIFLQMIYKSVIRRNIP